jgi:hypothetical protein
MDHKHTLFHHDRHERHTSPTLCMLNRNVGVVDMSMIVSQMYIRGLVVLQKCVDLLQNKDHHNQKVT